MPWHTPTLAAPVSGSCRGFTPPPPGSGRLRRQRPDGPVRVVSVGGRIQGKLEAQERLILRRDTHIDDLAHKLREERVRRVVEPILAAASETACSDEDLAYVRDLGLVTQDADGPPRIANRSTPRWCRGT